MSWSKVPLCKKRAKSMIFANDLCQPSVQRSFLLIQSNCFVAGTKTVFELT